MAFSTSAGVEQTAKLPVGMLWRCKNSLAKPLLVSSMAAARVGPKTRRPRSCRASTMPSESGSSGPTMVSPGCSASAWRTIAATSFRSTGTQRAICAIPPLPGAQTISVTRVLRFTAHASACSRPPAPKINTFMIASLLFLVVQDPERLSEQTGSGKSNAGEDDDGQWTYNSAMLKRIYIDNFRCFVNFEYKPERKQ